MPKNKTLYIPYIFPYSDIAAAVSKRSGLNFKPLPASNKNSIAEGRKHVLTNELLSLTALLGDIFMCLNGGIYQKNNKESGLAFFVPQFEGAEVDGQYSRLLRTALDKKGFSDCAVFSPFAEDFALLDKKEAREFFLGLIAGDIINNVSPQSRINFYDEALKMANNSFNEDILINFAQKAISENKKMKFKKSIFLAGEPLILYNSNLTDNIFKMFENEYGFAYASLAEAMLLLLKDKAMIEKNKNFTSGAARLENLFNYIFNEIKGCGVFFGIDSIKDIADKTMGYYAGASGRYREAAALCAQQNFDGIISVSSTYENTAISLNILHRGYGSLKPSLNLTFDGSDNGINVQKLESFLYYI